MAITSRKYIKTEDLDPAKFACSAAGLTALPRSFCAYCSDTAPPIPTNKDNYWLDTSVDPAVLYSASTGAWVAYPASSLVSGDTVACIGTGVLYLYCDGDDDGTPEWSSAAPPTATAYMAPGQEFFDVDFTLAHSPSPNCGSPAQVSGTWTLKDSGGTTLATGSQLAGPLNLDLTPYINGGDIVGATYPDDFRFQICYIAEDGCGVSDEACGAVTELADPVTVNIVDGVAGPPLGCTGVEADDLEGYLYNGAAYGSYAALEAAIVANEPTVTSAYIQCVGGELFVSVDSTATIGEVVLVESPVPQGSASMAAGQDFDNVDFVLGYTAAGSCPTPGQTSGNWTLKDGGGATVATGVALAGTLNLDMTPYINGGDIRGATYPADFTFQMCYVATDPCGSSVEQCSTTETVIPRLLDTYNYTGGDQFVTNADIPTWSGNMQLTVEGAGGGGGGGGVTGGVGGRVQRTIPPREMSLMLGVRYQLSRSTNGINPIAYGFGGPGRLLNKNPGSNTIANGGGLGGFFDGIAPITTTDFARAIVVAGGGGGAANNGSGSAFGNPAPGAGSLGSFLGGTASVGGNNSSEREAGGGGAGWRGSPGGVADNVVSANNAGQAGSNYPGLVSDGYGPAGAVLSSINPNNGRATILYTL